MTSDTGAVARIVEGLREIAEREAAHLAALGEIGGATKEYRTKMVRLARECLAIAERER